MAVHPLTNCIYRYWPIGILYIRFCFWCWDRLSRTFSPFAESVEDPPFQRNEITTWSFSPSRERWRKSKLYPPHKHTKKSMCVLFGLLEKYLNLNLSTILHPFVSRLTLSHQASSLLSATSGRDWLPEASWRDPPSRSSHPCLAWMIKA